MKFPNKPPERAANHLTQQLGLSKHGNFGPLIPHHTLEWAHWAGKDNQGFLIDKKGEEEKSQKQK